MALIVLLSILLSLAGEVICIQLGRGSVEVAARNSNGKSQKQKEATKPAASDDLIPVKKLLS